MGLDPIAGSLRAYLLACIDDCLPVDRARIARETGLGPEYALSVICRVISERHGIPGGPPWTEPKQGRPAGPRKPPKQREALMPCTCGQERHLSRCRVYRREANRRYRAKVA
jgi:hypothetical protein